MFMPHHSFISSVTNWTWIHDSTTAIVQPTKLTQTLAAPDLEIPGDTLTSNLFIAIPLT
jgi:hypothetical protein